MALSQTHTIPGEGRVASCETIQRKDSSPCGRKVPGNQVQARKASVSCEMGMEKNLL